LFLVVGFWRKIFQSQEKGITEWEGKKYHPDVSKTVRILPKGAYSGFYFAKIKKH